MRVYYLLITFYLVSCNYSEKNHYRSDLEVYIGNVKLSKLDSANYFHIYVSTFLINNTDNEFYLKNKGSKYSMLNESDFRGVYRNDTIIFEVLQFQQKIEPHDTVIFNLVCRFYEPKISNNLFFNEIKCIDVYYVPKKDSIEENPLPQLAFERYDSSKFVILRDNVWFEKAFVFGMYEFEPYLVDTTIMSYDKSLVTGVYIYDLCPK